MSDRYNQFDFMTYPESMGDIYNKIESLGLQCVRSPLHNKDVFVDTGEVKKGHYHNMIIFSSLKSRQQINEICSLLGIQHWEIVYDRRARLRYYCHLDCDPDSGKYKYPVSDVRTFNGFNYSSVLNDDERESKYTGVIRLISEYDIKSFRELVNVVLEKKPAFLDYIVDKAYFFNLYVRPRDQN